MANSRVIYLNKYEDMEGRIQCLLRDHILLLSLISYPKVSSVCF